MYSMIVMSEGMKEKAHKPRIAVQLVGLTWREYLELKAEAVMAETAPSADVMPAVKLVPMTETTVPPPSLPADGVKLVIVGERTGGGPDAADAATGTRPLLLAVGRRLIAQ